MERLGKLPNRFQEQGLKRMPSFERLKDVKTPQGTAADTLDQRTAFFDSLPNPCRPPIHPSYGGAHANSDQNFLGMMRQNLASKLRMAEEIYDGPYRLPLDQQQPFKDAVTQYRTALGWVLRFDESDNNTQGLSWNTLRDNYRNGRMSDVQKRIMSAAVDVMDEGFTVGCAQRPDKVSVLPGEGSWGPIRAFYSSGRWTPRDVPDADVAAVDQVTDQTANVQEGRVGTSLNVDIRRMRTNPAEAAHQLEIYYTKEVADARMKNPGFKIEDLLPEVLIKAHGEIKQWLQAGITNGDITQQDLQDALGYIKKSHIPFKGPDTRMNKLQPKKQSWREWATQPWHPYHVVTTLSFYLTAACNTISAAHNYHESNPPYLWIPPTPPH